MYINRINFEPKLDLDIVDRYQIQIEAHQVDVVSTDMQIYVYLLLEEH